MKTTAFAAMAACGLMLAACSPAAPPAPAASAAAEAPLPTEAEVLTAYDTLMGKLIAGDVDGVMALNSGEAVLFDPGLNQPITTVEANRKATEEFTALGATSYTRHWEKVQVLDADTAIVSTLATIETRNVALPRILFRSTDVLQRQPGGEWFVVNEHISQAPQPQTEQLPTTKTLPAAGAAPAPTPAH